jgi:iron complex outermembrane recepter protein
MLRFTFFFFFSCLCIASGAQNTITGAVFNSDGSQAAYATVLLWKMPDSTFVKGTAADSLGQYEILHTEQGQFRVTATLAGSGSAFTPIFKCNTATCIAPNVKFTDRTLQTVTITSRKPIIEALSDRLVFNVENSPLAAGLNGLELLRRSPGLALDPDNNISLRGKKDVQVFINGKRSPLAGADLAAFLQSLNASDIAAIEVIANPGAQFDAEGNAGVVNIRLKKNKVIGFNGNVAGTAMQGVTPKGDGSLSLNYRNGKFNVFGSGSYGDGIWHNDMELNSVVSDTLYAQSSPSWRRGRNLNLRTGLDLYLSPNHTIGVLLTGGDSHGESAGNSVNYVGIASTEVALKVLRSDRFGDFSRKNGNANLNYRFADTLGHTLNVDIDKGTFRNDGSDYMPNVWRNASESVVLEEKIYRNETPSSINIATMKADYEQKAGKTGKLGIGMKLSDVQTSNTFRFFNVSPNSEALDIDRSNAFTYKEKIQAGYISYETNLHPKWTAKAGLRGENTRAKGDLIAYKPVNERNVDTSYFLLFPSAALSYNPDWKHSMSLSYRRSLDRPNYRDLNPFEFKLDELNFSRGNPFLFPQTTNMFELSYTFKQMYSFSLSAAKTNNFFTNLTDTEVDPATGRQSFYLTKRNFGSNTQYNASVSAPIQFTKWWSMYGNVYVNHQILEGDFGGARVIDLSITNVGLWAQQTFRLGHDWNLECSGWFSSGGLWGAYVNRPQGMMDAGVSKKLWDGKGTLKMTFGDVFGTAGWRAETKLGALRTYGNGQWEARVFRISLSYRFGNQKLSKSRDRKTGIEEERNRTSD